MKFFGSLDGTQVNAAAALMKSFFSGLVSIIPNDITISLEADADVHTDSGVLQSVVPIGTVPAPSSGGDAGKWSAASGVCINWLTPGINNGTKVRGRTFIVPLASAAYDLDGTIDSTQMLTIRGAADALVAGTPDLCINSRKPPDGTGSNLTSVVTSSQVSDKVAVLRSRRD